jgi:hypothetical protein
MAAWEIAAELVEARATTPNISRLEGFLGTHVVTLDVRLPRDADR